MQNWSVCILRQRYIFSLKYQTPIPPIVGQTHLNKPDFHLIHQQNNLSNLKLPFIQPDYLIFSDKNYKKKELAHDLETFALFFF